jgi:hypothetical protein
VSKLIDGLILLAATALVSGLLAPYIVNRIQVNNQKRLKVYEGDLTRQSKIIEEQEALIRQLSSLLWEFQLALISPLYYGQRGFQGGQLSLPSDANSYEAAAKNYQANAVRLLGSIRGEIGGAVRLVPAEQWNTLKNLYYDQLLPLDLRVTILINEGPTKENSDRWTEEQRYILKTFAEILDETINGLAGALGLKYQKL